MAARRSKSKKLSDGSVPSRSPSPPDDFILYLDENLCNSRAILDALADLSVRAERHVAHFPRGTADETWLPVVGSNSWILLTADKRIRYNLLEKRALEQHAVREFVFASGNMSGQDMAAALQVAIPNMRRLCRKQKAPFVASITRRGQVHVRWPKDK